MIRTTVTLLVTFFFTTCQAQDIRISGLNGTGTLVFSDGVNGSYSTLYYNDSKGQRIDIFDSGLEFYYADRSDRYMSPDKVHYFVSFSETGSIEDGVSSAIESKEYMCAFVRMSDGCIVRVDSGEICGGRWEATSQWIGLNGSRIENLEISRPTASKVFSEYSSRIKDASVNSSPRIMKYLPEGTAFDNLLACDPVGSNNHRYYKDLLKLLWRDGDSIDAKKVAKALRK